MGVGVMESPGGGRPAPLAPPWGEESPASPAKRPETASASPRPWARRGPRPAPPARPRRPVRLRKKAPRVRSPRAALRTASAALGGRPRPAAVGLLDSCGGLRPGRWATRRYSRRVLSQRPRRSSPRRQGPGGVRRGQAAGGRERPRPRPRPSRPCGASGASPAPARRVSRLRPAGWGGLAGPPPRQVARPSPPAGRPLAVGFAGVRVGQAPPRRVGPAA